MLRRLALPATDVGPVFRTSGRQEKPCVPSTKLRCRASTGQRQPERPGGRGKSGHRAVLNRHRDGLGSLSAFVSLPNRRIQYKKKGPGEEMPAETIGIRRRAGLELNDEEKEDGGVKGVS